jgi:predicted NBD/HSP70 family sugar kinase
MTDTSLPTGHDVIPTHLRGNNLDHVRRRNLSLVLGRVHQLRAISRAHLTRETGLNRSTIADLVAELVQLGLVTETDPDSTSQVGRPSPVVVPSDRVVSFTVNPELDAVTIAVVALGGRVLRQVRHDAATIPTVHDLVRLAAESIANLRSDLGTDYRTVGIGLAIPGLVRAQDGLVTLAPHLDWHDEPVSALLRDATGIEVVAANDASLGAIAESIRGAGLGCRDLVYLNGGASGIGGGIIAGGVLLGGVSGYAGEIGHTLVTTPGKPCHCGSTGCLETEVTRRPLLEALDLAPTEAPRLDEVLRERAQEPGVAAIVDQQVESLARALANTVNIFNSERIVLGGFLASLHAVAADRLPALVRERALTGPRDDIQIVPATLGRDILAVGAAELAFTALIADPAGTLS